MQQTFDFLLPIPSLSMVSSVHLTLRPCPLSSAATSSSPRSVCCPSEGSNPGGTPLAVMVSVREECAGLDVFLGIILARVCKEGREVLAIIGGDLVGGGCVGRRFEDITAVVLDAGGTNDSRKPKRLSLPPPPPAITTKTFALHE